MGEDSSYRHHDRNGSILIVRLQRATTWYYISIKDFQFQSPWAGFKEKECNNNGQQTFCQDGRFVRKTFCQDRLRHFVRKTSCQDHLRRFVRTDLP